MGGARKSLCAFVVGWECRLDIAMAAATMVGAGLRSPSTYLFYGLISR